MRDGQKMIQMHIVNIFGGTIGTGKRIHHTGIRIIILERLLGPVQELHYHTITQSLALTGILHVADVNKYLIYQIK